MGRGSSNQSSAKRLLYGPRRRGQRPTLQPHKVQYRPLYLGLTALAVMTTCETDLADQAAVKLGLIRAGGDLAFKAAERGWDVNDFLDRGERTLWGDVEDYDADYEGPAPKVGTSLFFSAEQNLYIRPPQESLKRANKAILTCYPDEISSEDVDYLQNNPALAFADERLDDTMANLLHIARVREIDIGDLKKHIADRAALVGLKENRAA